MLRIMMQHTELELEVGNRQREQVSLWRGWSYLSCKWHTEQKRAGRKDNPTRHTALAADKIVSK